MKGSLHFPVIIVGGGPAGLATSITLSARGIKHCIVDAHSQPINKPGEAIPPNAKPLFRQLGIDALLNDPLHLPYYGNKSCWGDDDLRQEEFIADIHGHGHLLNRLHFESQLRHITGTPQCTPFWGFQLKSLSESEDGISAKLQSDAENLAIKSSLVVDATGRKASVCRHLGIFKTKLDDQFGLAFHLTRSPSVKLEIHIESTERGWWYSAPFGEDELTLMFFTLRELIPSKEEVRNLLVNELENTQFITGLVANEKIDIKEVKTMPAGTSCLNIPFGKNWLAVGDAAYAYDPISSFGITSGLAGGFYGGHALADSLSGKSDALDVYRYVMENAFQAYLEKLEAQYDLEKRWSGSPYWGNRFSILTYN